jgi:hypothetical protein
MLQIFLENKTNNKQTNKQIFKIIRIERNPKWENGSK